MDLGADGWQTFRYVTLPAIATALVAGGAAGVRAVVRRDRRDELRVGAGDHPADVDLQQPATAPTNRPIVNVVAMVVMLLSLIPVYLAQRLAGGEGSASGGRSGRRKGAVEAPLEE